jgi:hypothetical protein
MSSLRGCGRSLRISGVVNYGCPGESTVTFARGDCPGLADGFKLHDAYHGAQLRAADSFLQAHDGDVSPVTLTLLRPRAWPPRNCLDRRSPDLDPEAPSGRGS